MNPLMLYFSSGESLYSGAGLLLLLIALTPFIKNRWLLRVRALLLWISLAFMVMACPPFPYWLDAFFLGTFVGWFVAWSAIARPPTPLRRRARLLTTAALTVLTLLLPLLELPRRARPVFTGTSADHLVIIGDSISAGIFNEKPWPELFAARTGIPVTNLSTAGDETSDALAKTAKLTDRDTLVLLEIGGNDLLAGVSTAEFAARLDKLLAACTAPPNSPNRTVIMFELPLLPHRIGYGMAQRRLAARYHVQLIPKRYFINVLRAGTSDGLHLSPNGAQHMAAHVESLLDPLLRRSTTLQSSTAN
jgi:acyl-CoA thioesterase I